MKNASLYPMVMEPCPLTERVNGRVELLVRNDTGKIFGGSSEEVISRRWFGHLKVRYAPTDLILWKYSDAT